MSSKLQVEGRGTSWVRADGTPQPATNAAAQKPAATKGPTSSHELVRALAERGVTRVFGIPGGTIAPLFDALLDSEIECVVCQHETMAVYAACGYAEATGLPAVVLVTSGPGILNAMTGVAAAFHGEVPLLLIAGEVGTSASGKGALQDGGSSGLDVHRLMGPITKSVEALSSATRVVPMVDQAMTLAQSVPAGPVFLRLPVDVAGAPAQTVRFVATEPTRAPEPSADACAEVAERIAIARRPVIFAGVGARRAGVGPALRRLAELGRCQVVTDVEAKGLFPEGHPLYAGTFGVGARGAATALVAGDVDLLITVGARLDDTTTNNFSALTAPGRTLVQIDHDPRRLGRAYRADIAMSCDLGRALHLIAQQLPDSRYDDTALAVETMALAGPVEPLVAAPHDPRLVLAHLRAALPDDAVFTCDIGNHLLFAATELSLDRSDSFYVSIGLGGMGSGIGYAVGLQLGLGERREVVSICGDGGMLMVGNELATCAKYGIPALFVVFNDGHLNMVQHGLERVFGRSLDCRTPEVDFCAYARSLGVDAVRLSTDADLRAVVERSRAKPMLLEVPIDPDFRAHNPRESTISYNFPAPRPSARRAGA